MDIKPPLQKIMKGILHIEDQNNHSHGRMGILKVKRRTDKQSESSIELVAHTQILI
jgi:hypothetical protein